MTCFLKSRLSLVISLLFGFVLLGCKEDEVPRSKIEFDYVQHDRDGRLIITESDGTMSSFHPELEPEGVGVEYEINILLDKPATETVVIRFSTVGPAKRRGPFLYGDFDIEPNGNLITINKGEQSASLLLRVFEDYELEYSTVANIEYLVESFSIILEEVVSGPGVIGENNAFSVFIKEDDAIVFLEWDPLDEGGADPGDVNMDLFIWYDANQVASSANDGITYEMASFAAGSKDGQYGFSYTYYSGSSDFLAFYVEFLNPYGLIDGSKDRKYFIGTYSADNKNKYDKTGIQPAIIQTMDKVGLNIINLSDLSINASGSRLSSSNKTRSWQSFKPKFKAFDASAVQLLEPVKR